jgi:putative flippase GtrA
MANDASGFFVMKWRPYLLSEKRVPFRTRQFFRFVFVGGAGFCIDGGLLTVLMQSAWEILPARSISFFSAVTCTWLLNRFWTFELDRRIGIRREYAAYIATQVIGALINLTVFFALIELHPLLQDTPLIPLAFGAAVSLAFNYATSKKYVFKG